MLRKGQSTILGRGVVTSDFILVEEPEAVYDAYTKDDFLQDVYMSEERYNTLAALLLTKKNIILQGAPGVGKLMQRRGWRIPLWDFDLYRQDLN